MDARVVTAASSVLTAAQAQAHSVFAPYLYPGTDVSISVVTLSATEHQDIRWCSAADLDTLQPSMSGAVKWYCRKALQEAASSGFF